ncbi:type II toxin-antitoxin system RelE/ParE family toxin [Candidatus Tisiphia endosymbiont of Hybos culiciformis]|uniref:type II toxin-antitoxin system RelE/ParE family toxin n=1 Tax=Candidatus Tisiphia endosymbiont of Hybos culiciformis TaxID=3139331 RepID=UPI003CCB4D75
MHILQTNTFKKVAKKLHPNQKDCLDNAIRIILSDPLVGIEKVGDLSNIRVYKFRMIEQHTILAYMYNQREQSIILLALGSHENFYRDLKTQLD